MLTHKSAIIALLLCAPSLFLLSPAHAAVHSHLYAAHPYTFGTRFERNHLTTIDAWITHGTTTHAHNAQQKKTNVLNMYGAHQMHQLGKNLANENLSDTSIDVLNALWHVIPTDDAYAQLKFEGKCAYTGGNVALSLNFTDAFFVGSDVPFYKLAIKSPTYTDITPTDAKNAEWLQFLNRFDTILQEEGLTRAATDVTGVGDISLFVGWTKSFDELENFNFFDATLRLGATLGTAEKKDQDKVFSIAPGHDGHKGIFASCDLAFGTSEWVSLGFHAHELFLFKKEKSMRVQSAHGQNGFIKLSKTTIDHSQGNTYEVGGHAKFEYDVASLFVGYTYCHKDKDTLVSKDTTLYPSDIINNDSMLQGWSMHTLHVGAEFDFSNEEQRLHPKVSFFYNYIVRARTVFLNNTYGGSAGLALTWDL